LAGFYTKQLKGWRPYTTQCNS